MKPNPRVMRWLLAVCVALAVGYIVGWLVFGFAAYTLLGLVGVICTGTALALGLRELRKREPRDDGGASAQTSQDGSPGL